MPKMEQRTQSDRALVTVDLAALAAHRDGVVHDPMMGHIQATVGFSSLWLDGSPACNSITRYKFGGDVFYNLSKPQNELRNYQHTQKPAFNHHTRTPPNQHRCGNTHGNDHTSENKTTKKKREQRLLTTVAETASSLNRTFANVPDIP